MILFQIKVFGRNILETIPARYFIKVTARPWPTKYTALCHILKAKIKRPVFRKLKSYEFMNFCLILAIEFPKKKIMEVLRIENLKYDKNFQLTHCFF